jgi:hypothetical protein
MSEEVCGSRWRAKSQCTDGVYTTAQGLMVVAPIPSKFFVLRVIDCQVVSKRRRAY